MSITIICPKLTCRAILRVPDNVRGKRVRCSECGLAFLIPESASRPKPSPAPMAENPSGKK